MIDMLPLNNTLAHRESLLRFVTHHVYAGNLVKSEVCELLYRFRDNPAEPDAEVYTPGLSNGWGSIKETFEEIDLPTVGKFRKLGSLVCSLSADNLIEVPIILAPEEAIGISWNRALNLVKEYVSAESALQVTKLESLLELAPDRLPSVQRHTHTLKEDELSALLQMTPFNIWKADGVYLITLPGDSIGERESISRNARNALRFEYTFPGSTVSELSIPRVHSSHPSRNGAMLLRDLENTPLTPACLMNCNLRNPYPPKERPIYKHSDVMHVELQDYAGEFKVLEGIAFTGDENV